MVPNFDFFWQKKRRNYWPRARAERNPDTAKKLVKIRVDTVSFLCILLVPNALPKRERSLWLPPQNVLRQIRPLLQILSRQLRPGFSQVKIYLKKNINVWPDSLFYFYFSFLFHWLLCTFFKCVSTLLRFCHDKRYICFVFWNCYSNVDFFSLFFLPRIWKITSEPPVRSPTLMRINQDMAKGKFTLNSNFMFSFSYMRYSRHSFTNNQNHKSKTYPYHCLSLCAFV